MNSVHFEICPGCGGNWDKNHCSSCALFSAMPDYNPIVPYLFSAYLYKYVKDVDNKTILIVRWYANWNGSTISKPFNGSDGQIIVKFRLPYDIDIHRLQKLMLLM